jgi:hypothetical protein
LPRKELKNSARLNSFIAAIKRAGYGVVVEKPAETNLSKF